MSARFSASPSQVMLKNAIIMVQDCAGDCHFICVIVTLTAVMCDRKLQIGFPGPWTPSSMAEASPGDPGNPFALLCHVM
jgi:hypothetical protein